MNEHQSGWPPRFDAFLAHRARFLDRMAADALLGEIEAAAGSRVLDDPGGRVARAVPDGGTPPGPGVLPDPGGPAAT
jgi:hypothetical protein